MKKKLYLRKETVALLESEQANVYGGAAITCGSPYCPMSSLCEESSQCPIYPVTEGCAYSDAPTCVPVTSDCPATDPQICIVVKP